MRTLSQYAVTVFAWVRKQFHRDPISGVGSADLICVGLGNPGPRYENTRHNAGFMVIEALASSLASVTMVQCTASITWTGILPDGRKIILAKPQTFMNDSGRAVKELLSLSGLSPSACLVIVDDLNLSLGRMRFRKNGSDGGHNGLKSIIGAIGQDFPRLRIGIGPIPAGTPVIDFVLGEFSSAEKPTVLELTGRAAESISAYMQLGIDAAMSKYN